MVSYCGTFFFSSYMFIAPNTFWPGRPFTVHGRLLKIPSRAVTVTVTLLGKASVSADIAQTHVVLTDDSGKVLMCFLQIRFANSEKQS